MVPITDIASSEVVGRAAKTDGLPESTTTTTTRPQTSTSAAAEPGEDPRPFTEHASITTWYSDAEADDSAWVHFKAVDVGGDTVAEILGSDLIDLVEEADAMAMTPERVVLVNGLRQTMVDGGWTELGVAGEWCEYEYGR